MGSGVCIYAYNRQIRSEGDVWGYVFEIRQDAHQNTIIISLVSRKEMEYNRSARVKGAQRLDVIFVPSIQTKKYRKKVILVAK